MRRIEVAFSFEDRAILVEGDEVAAESWSCSGDAVMLHDGGGAVVASGVAGPLSKSILPALSEIKVFAVTDAGVRQVRTLRKLAA